MLDSSATFPAAGSDRTPYPSGGGARQTAATGLVAWLAVVFIAAHVPFIPNTPDGIDSANFTLAVARYDPSLHQPHPPGYPVHVAVGRFIAGAYETFAWWRGEHEGGSLAAAGLRIWSVVSGAFALFALSWMAMSLGVSPRRATLVAALAAACPLFWISAMRPISDVPGVCFALAAQALTLAAYNRRCRRALLAGRDASAVDYRLIAAAAVAGVALGIRVQTALLTIPLLTLVTVDAARRVGAIVIPQIALAVACGVAVWAIPMMAAVGGVDAYTRLITTVAADDVAGVEMLATNPGPRLLALALFRTFVVPWNNLLLGWCVIALAASGAIALWLDNRRTFAFIAAMTVPYLVFHLLFQETASTRYALPLVPATSLLVFASPLMRSRHAAVLATGLLIVVTGTSVVAADAYGRTRSPIVRALEDIGREAAARPHTPTLAFHHAVGRAIRGEPWPGRVLSGRVGYEWLELSDYWLDGGAEPVWFLSDDRRADLALIDPRARRRIRSYRWPGTVERLLGGAQPLAVSWHEVVPPEWFLMRGWSLTADSAGVSSRDNRSPGATGISGYVRRRAGGAVMMIGGRNVGSPDETGAVIQVAIDGTPRASWVVSPQSAFLHVVRLPPGGLEGAPGYATLDVSAWDVAGTARRTDVIVDHFDLRSPGSAMVGPGSGWHSPEIDPLSGTTWRWTDDEATLRVEGFAQDVEVVIRGESPLRYFQRPPRVVVSAGDVELASFQPESDFEWVIPATASDLAASRGVVTIESDSWFVPEEVSGNGDRRRLALRIYSLEARLRAAASPDAH